jgi:hypothetical protein
MAFTRSGIHERTISLRFLGIIWRFLRLEVSIYNVSLQTSFKPLLLKGGGGGKIRYIVEVTMKSKEEIT